MYSIHFSKEWKLQSLEVLIRPIDKNSPVCDLCFMTLAWLEFHFAFQVNIPSCEQSLVEIGINCPDRKIKFRMVGDDLIGRLSLLNQR